MKNDKLLQHQLNRLKKLLLNDKAHITWGKPTPWGERVIEMYFNAIKRSLKRFRLSL
jgi:hypothetical protein